MTSPHETKTPDPSARETSANELPRPVAGRLFAAGGDVLVCRYPVATDLPIPLAVVAPAGVGLLTWAFAGLDAAAPDPVGLLVLSDRAGALRTGGTLTLETHFRDLSVTCPGPRPVADLPPAARAALGEAVLAAVMPETLGILATLFPLLAPVVADRPVPEAAPRLRLARDTDATAVLSGSAVPNYLLLRAGMAWSCARVAEATLRFGPSPEVRLALAPAWGSPRGGAVEQALLLGTGSVGAAVPIPGDGR